MRQACSEVAWFCRNWTLQHHGFAAVVPHGIPKWWINPWENRKHQKIQTVHARVRGFWLTGGTVSNCFSIISYTSPWNFCGIAGCGWSMFSITTLLRIKNWPSTVMSDPEVCNHLASGYLTSPWKPWPIEIDDFPSFFQPPFMVGFFHGDDIWYMLVITRW